MTTATGIASRPRTRANWARAAVLGTIVLWSLFPIYWIALSSFKTRLQALAEVPLFWFVPTFDAYVRLFSSPSMAVYDQFVNSVVVTVSATVLTLIIAGSAAFTLARHQFRAKGAVLTVILGSRLLPPVSAVVPLFVAFSAVGLVDSRLGLILIYAALDAPFACWLLKSFFEGVPRELEEAAGIDGCTKFGTFVRITLPLAAPGIAATAIIVASLAWNEFMFAFIFTATDASTLPVSLAELRAGEQIPWQDLGARATLLMAPVLALGLWAQKYLVAGLTAGAVK